MDEQIVRIRPDVSVTSVFETEGEESQVMVTYDFGSEICLLGAPDRARDAAVRLGSGELLHMNSLNQEERDMVSMFLTRGWAVATGLEQPGRYQRQEAYFQARLPATSGAVVQEDLSRKRVAIVGCGGVGSNMALMLAMSGVGNIYLVDGDIVDESNLNRQIAFSLGENSVGSVKVDFLAQVLESSFGTVTEGRVSRLDTATAEWVRSLSPDLVVIAADEPSILEVVTFAVAQFVGTPLLVGGGYLGQRSYVGPLLGLVGPPCLDCLQSAFGAESRVKPSRPNIGGTIGPIAAHAAAQASAIVVHMLTGLLSVDHPVVNGVSQFDHARGECDNRTLICQTCSDGSVSTGRSDGSTLSLS